MATAELTKIADLRVAEDGIRQLATEYMSLSIDGLEDKEGFNRVHEARMDVKRKRIAIEKQRKELNKEALDWQRTVNGEAKRLTELIEPIESHLKSEEDDYNSEVDRIKREEEEREQERIRQRLKALADCGVIAMPYEVDLLSDEDFDAKLAAARQEKRKRDEAEAERKRQEEAAKRKEEERLAKERAELERQRKEQEERERLLNEERAKQRQLEQERLAQERAELEEQREKEEAEREERLAAEREQRRLHEERLAKERAELESERRRLDEEKRQAEAAERAKREEEERKKREAEEAKRKAELEAERQRRIEAARPDIEKLTEFAKFVGELALPELSDERAMESLRIVVNRCAESVSDLADSLVED